MKNNRFFSGCEKRLTQKITADELSKSKHRKGLRIIYDYQKTEETQC